MTAFLLAALLAALIATAIAVVRWLVDDGGPRSEPMPRTAENWHPRLPSHAYVTDH